MNAYKAMLREPAFDVRAEGLLNERGHRAVFARAAQEVIQVIPHHRVQRGSPRLMPCPRIGHPRLTSGSAPPQGRTPGRARERTAPPPSWGRENLKMPRQRIQLRRPQAW